MRFIDGRIILEEYHFERLSYGLDKLGFEKPGSLTKENLRLDIAQECKRKKISGNTRVKLSVFLATKNMGSEKMQDQYQVEAWPLDEGDSQWNKDGLLVHIFSSAKKKCDQFSNLKTINRDIYNKAEEFYRQHQLDDCLILNEHDRICESTIANIFWIKNEIIYTVPLSEGCVAGVMRRYLMEKLPDSGYEMREREMGIKELKEADEVFLTNAIKGVRWIMRCSDSYYSNKTILKIYTDHIEKFLINQKLTE